MRCRVLGWLTLAASAFAVAAAARAEPPLTLRDIRALPTPALALRLLGPERGADIVRIEGVPDARVRASVLQVFLYARPVPLGSNYCSQRRYYRALASAASGEIGPLRRGQPLRILAGWEEPTLARPRLPVGRRPAFRIDPRARCRDACPRRSRLRAGGRARDGADDAPAIDLPRRGRMGSGSLPRRRTGGARAAAARRGLPSRCG